MAELASHSRQAQRNKDFANYIKGVGYPEWEVTAMFYCALHRMHWYIHKFHRGTDEQMNSHQKFNCLVGNLCPENLSKTYLRLYKHSLKARYSCVSVDADVKVVHDNLQSIIHIIENIVAQEL